jgi:hypothetical protein
VNAPKKTPPYFMTEQATAEVMVEIAQMRERMRLRRAARDAMASTVVRSPGSPPRSRNADAMRFDETMRVSAFADLEHIPTAGDRAANAAQGRPHGPQDDDDKQQR